MADQRLVDYIRDNMQRGYSADYLMDALVRQGWNINDVHEAINIVQGYSMPQEQPGMQPQTPYGAQQQPAAKPAQQAGPRHRPAGVTIICVLGFLYALFILFAGYLIFSVGQLVGGTVTQNAAFFGNETGLMGGIGSFISLLSGYMGIILIILALVTFVGFSLLWRMKKAGWIIVIVIGIIAIISNLTDLLNFNLDKINVFTICYIVLWAVIIVYLSAKRKLFF